MSAIIKQGDPRSRTGVRAMARPGRSALERLDPAAARLAFAEAEIERLTDALATKEGEIAEAREDRDKAFARGNTEGLEQGRLEGEERRAAALALLETGMAEAARLYQVELAELQRLAPLLTKAALERLIGDEADRFDLIVASLKLQLDGLDQAAIVQAEVSGEDFPDPAQLAVLASALGAPRLNLVVNDSLKGGECRLRLTLGALEIGPAQQWRRLAVLLEDLAAEAAP